MHLLIHWPIYSFIHLVPHLSVIDPCNLLFIYPPTWLLFFTHNPICYLPMYTSAAASPLLNSRKRLVKTHKLAEGGERIIKLQSETALPIPMIWLPPPHPHPQHTPLAWKERDQTVSGWARLARWYFGWTAFTNTYTHGLLDCWTWTTPPPNIPDPKCRVARLPDIN